MTNYNDLPPKGKFIRTCIAFPVCIVLLILTWFLLNRWFLLGTGFIIKYIIVCIITVAVGIWQLVTTYQAYKNDRDGY